MKISKSPQLKLGPPLRAAVLLLITSTASAMYDPGLQRWLTRDPQQETGGVNLHGFVANNPAKNFDPDGRGIFSGLFKGLAGARAIMNLIDPPCLNSGITPKKCDVLFGGGVTFGNGPGAVQTCTYQCTDAHPTDEPNSAPPPTIAVVLIPLGYSCPSDPDLPPVPPVPPGVPVLSPSRPNPKPAPPPSPPILPLP